MIGTVYQIKKYWMVLLHLTLSPALGCSDSKSDDKTETEEATNVTPSPRVSPQPASQPVRSGDGVAASSISSENTEVTYLGVVAALPENKISSFWVNPEGLFTVNHFDGTSWGSASSHQGGDGIVKSVKYASEASGKIVVTWILDKEAENSLWARVYNGDTWSDFIQISQSGAISEYEVVTSRSGEFVVVWNDSEQMWMNTYDGDTWGEAIDLDLTLAGAQHLNIQVTIDKKIFLAWSSFKEGKRYVWTSAYYDGQWDSLNLVAQPETEIGLIKSSMTDNGKLALLWKEVAGDKHDVWFSQLADTDWLEPVNILSSDKPVKNDHIIIHQNGRAVYSWIEVRDNYDYIFSKVYDGGFWSEKPLLVAQNLESDSYFKVASDYFSGTHLIWSQTDGSLWMNSLETGSSWNGTLRLNASSQDPIIDYAISFNKAGRSFITWNQKSSIWFKLGPN